MNPSSLVASKGRGTHGRHVENVVAAAYVDLDFSILEIEMMRRTIGHRGITSSWLSR